MNTVDVIVTGLLTPMLLAFLLGVIASLLKSNLKFPDALYISLTIYLLFAIGLKGGYKLSESDFRSFIFPAVIGIIIGVLIPLWSYAILREAGKLSPQDSAAVAAQYGSVSVVTFVTAVSFLDAGKIYYEGFMPSLLSIFEIPGIISALFLARKFSGNNMPLKNIFHEIFTNRGTVLLIGGLAIGLLTGASGYKKVSPFFEDLFYGVLTIFLLEMGLAAGKRLNEVRKAGFFLFVFGIIMPVFHAVIGIFAAKFTGLSEGGALVFAVLMSSASYVAAPAAVRIAIPSANPALYITSSLAITFPFNITFGIPLYFLLTKHIYTLI